MNRRTQGVLIGGGLAVATVVVLAVALARAWTTIFVSLVFQR